MEENILASIKQLIGSEDDYEHFNRPLILCINSAFSILFQLGVGPTDKAFSILDGSEVWSDFTDEAHLELVKNYIGIKAQKMFDPPANSFLMSALNDMEKEYEWRLTVMAETP